MTTDTITMYAVQHLRAPNDVNGNPRRCYVLYRLDDDGAWLVEVRDEGYAGEPREWMAHPHLRPIDVSARVYRRFLSTSPDEG